MPLKPVDPRVAWISTVGSASDVTPGHQLQLASLAPSSGFPLCSASLPISTKVIHAQDSSPVASSSTPTILNGKGKGKGKANAPIVLSSDDEDDPINSFSSDELEIGLAKPTECNKRKCENNPNCLRWCGQALWNDKDKALESFLKSPLLGPNPMEISRSPGVPVGLKLGATCYAAALLQTWFHNHRFRNAVYRLATTVEPDQPLQSSPAHQLQTVFYGLQESCLVSWDPKGLVESLELNEDQQQDAQEFSKLFMSMLAAEFAKQEDEDLKSLVEDQFEGDLAYVTKCKKCKTQSERPSKFLELELTMTPNAKLEDRLRALLEKETLTGDNKIVSVLRFDLPLVLALTLSLFRPRRYNCSHCNSLQDAERKIQLTSVPPIIHFSLLRFVFEPETMSRKKSKSMIKFPSSIDMADYLSSSNPKSKGTGKAEAEVGTIYDLRGVLVHTGSSAYSGHYCAEVYSDEDGKWYNCDDEQVTVIKSLTPPHTDKPFRPVVESTATLGHIDSYFDKTPKPARVKNGKADGKKKEPEWVTVEDSSSDDRVVLAKMADGSTKLLSGTGSKRRAPSTVPSEERTPTNKKSKAEISDDEDAKPPLYHSSKDAYMLVYARREAPNPAGSPSTSSVASVVPPREVVDAINAVNVAHQAGCETWATTQVAMEQTFKEVLAAKTAVFDSWQIKTFDEPSYLVEKSALVKWTIQGLNIKLKKKTSYSAAAPPPVATESEAAPVELATNGDVTDPLPPPPPPSDPLWKPEIEEIVMANPEPSAEGKEDAAVVVQEEVKPPDPSTIKELAIKQACQKTFLNHSLLCIHGNVDPRPRNPTPFKRISAAAFDLLNTQMGCEFQPVLAVDPETICEICTKEIYTLKTYKEKHPQDVAKLKKLNEVDSDRGHYLISRKWYSEFTGGTIPAFFKVSNERDPMPTEESWRADLICEHNEKATKNNQQKLISPEAYAFLRTIFPDLQLYRFTEDSCAICESVDYEKELAAAPDKLRAEEEKTSLSGLIKHFKTALTHDNLFVDETYYIVDPQFLKDWNLWIKNPVGHSRPTKLNNRQFVCEHGLVDFDLNSKYDRKEQRYAVLYADEWEKISALYESDIRLRFQFFEVEGTAQNRAIMEPGPCEDCRRARIKDFEDGFIRGFVIPAKDDPRLLENSKKELKARSESPPVRGYGSDKPPTKLIPAPTRQSSRVRTSTGEKKPRVIRVPTEPTTTVKEFKISAATILKTTVLHLSLRRDNIDLDDNSKLLSQVDCLPGDIIHIIQIDGGDQDEDAFLNNSDGEDVSSSRRRPEADSGFGGTRLGGGGARAAAANRNGNGSSRSRDASSVSGAEDDWDMQPMAEPGAAPAANGDGGLNCPGCTFANAPGMTVCEMCDTPL